MRSHKPKEWTEAEVQMLIKLSKEGLRSAEIASALERYLASVRRVARNMGLALKSVTRRSDRAERPSRHRLSFQTPPTLKASVVVP